MAFNVHLNGTFSLWRIRKIASQSIAMQQRSKDTENHEGPRWSKQGWFDHELYNGQTHADVDVDLSGVLDLLTLLALSIRM